MAIKEKLQLMDEMKQKNDADWKLVTDEEIRQARNTAARKYYAEHKERIRETNKEWRKRNKDKIRTYTENHWRRVAERMRKEGNENG